MTSSSYSVQDILSDLDKLQEWESSTAAAASSSTVNPSLHPILELGRSISNPFDSHSDSSRLASLDDEAQSQSRFGQLLDSFDSKKSSTSSSAAESSISDHVQLASLFIQSAQKALQLDQSQPFSETQLPQDAPQDSSRIETLHGTIAKLQARAEDKEKSLLAALQALEAQT